jgi:hypothetical protein
MIFRFRRDLDRGHTAQIEPVLIRVADHPEVGSSTKNTQWWWMVVHLTLDNPPYLITSVIFPAHRDRSRITLNRQ